MSGSERSGVGGRAGEGEPRTPDRPWPGLGSFTLLDEAFFGGRERETRAVAQLIKRDCHAVVFGRSGLGKTSLLCAGVMPQLRREGFLPIYLRMGYGTAAREAPGGTPLEQVKEGIAGVLDREGIDGPRPSEGETLWEYFQRADNLLWEGARWVTPVLIFDQFEEIFTHGRRGGAATAGALELLEELECLVEGRAPERVRIAFQAEPAATEAYDFERRSFKVVWVLREDFLAELEAFRGRFHLVPHNRFRLEPFTGPQAVVAVRTGGGHLIDEATTRLVVWRITRRGDQAEDPTEADVASLKEVEPALLSLLCSELNEQRLAGRAEGDVEAAPSPVIDRKLVLASGDQVLPEFYRRCVGPLHEWVIEFIEERLLAGHGRYRQAAAVDDFLAVPGASEAVLDRLINMRLLRRDERFGASTIELIHDRLVGVVRSAREEREAKRREQTAERERAASEWGRIEAERKIRRRNLVVGVMAGITLVAIVSMGLAFRAQREAKEKEAEAYRLSGELRFALDATNRIGQEKARLLVERETLVTNLLQTGLELTNAVESLIDMTGRLGVANTNLTKGQEELRKRNRELEIARQEADESRHRAMTKEEEARTNAELRTRGLFESYLTSAILLARGGAFDEAARALEGSRKLDGDPALPPGRTVTRDLLGWFNGLQTTAPVLSGQDGGAPIRDVANSPDGRFLVAVGENGRVTVYEAMSGRRLDTPIGHPKEATVRVVLFHPSGREFMTAGDDQRIVRWATPGLTSTRPPFLHSGPVVAMAMHPTGRLLVAVEARGFVKIWDTESDGVPVEVEGAFEAATSLAFLPDGTGVVVGTAKGEVWSLELRSPGNSEGAQDSARMADSELGEAGPPGGTPPAGDRRFKGGGRGPIVERVRRLIAFGGAIRNVAVHPDGGSFVTGCEDGTIQVWAYPEGRIRRVMSGHRQGVTSLGFSRDGEWLVSGGQDRTLRVWGWASGEPVAVYEGHSASVTAVAVASEYCFSGANDGTWRKWPLLPPGSGGIRVPRPGDAGRMPWPMGIRVTSCALAPDASRVALGTETGAIGVFRLPDGELLGTWQGHTGRVSRLAFRGDGGALVSGGFDGGLGLWRGERGERIRGVVPDRRWRSINAVAISAGETDGRWVAVAGLADAEHRLASGPDRVERQPAGFVALLDLESGEVRTTAAHRGEAHSVAFDVKGGRFLSSGDDGRVLEWERSGFPGMPRAVRPGSSEAVAWAEFDPTGATLAMAGRDGRITLVDGVTGGKKGSLTGHENTVVRFAFGPGGGEILSVSTDRTLRGWDVEGRRELFTLRLPIGATVRNAPLDFSFVSKGANGEAWLAIPVTPGSVVVHRMGTVYR